MDLGCLRTGCSEGREKKMEALWILILKIVAD
jgi:hypothetical protein